MPLPDWVTSVLSGSPGLNAGPISSHGRRGKSLTSDQIATITGSVAYSDDSRSVGTTTTRSSYLRSNPPDVAQIYRTSMYPSGPCVYENPLDPRLPQESYFPPSPESEEPVLTVRGGGTEPSAEAHWTELLTATLDHFSSTLRFACSKKVRPNFSSDLTEMTTNPRWLISQTHPFLDKGITQPPILVLRDSSWWFPRSIHVQHSSWQLSTYRHVVPLRVRSR
jgi:hypothetical protein